MKTTTILLGIAFYICIGMAAEAQTLKGTAIAGEASGDVFGYSISMPDANTVAIGAHGNDSNGSDAGQVRIYAWNGSDWAQKGANIDGNAAGDWSGYSVSMPDANTVAIGAPRNDGNGSDAGQVRVYTWNGNDWIQKGADIYGETSGDQAGYSVSMPDANTVAIGAPYNYGNGNTAGQVRIYIWNGSSWVQQGADIDGEAIGDWSGAAVSMPDANTVAIGAVFNNNANGTDAGHVRIYTWDGSSWVLKGADIDGETANDLSGFSVSMPDANTVAIGAHSNDDNGSNAGHVRVYTWSGSSWLQKGVDIDGEAAGDWSGYSVDMPDANTVAIGAIYNAGNGINAGQVRIFTWSGSAWIQQGPDIEGEAAGDQIGYSVNMPDANVVATGVPNVNAGQVRVYSLCANSSSTSDIIVCDSYVSPSGNYTWTTSGTYMDTILNSAGCDSLLTINLTVHKAAYDTATVSACDSYTWSRNNQSYSTSGKYSFVVANAVGGVCDSIYVLDLAIYKAAYDTATVSACDSYTWPRNNQSYSTSGKYSFVVANAVGGVCDSTYVLDLAIYKAAYDTATVSACDIYTWSRNNQSYNTSGKYSFVATNAVGGVCDSTYVLDLTIKTSDAAITNNGTTLSANANSATYQWLDCNNNMSPITGATDKTFVPTGSGSYAVEVTQNGCTAVSDCEEVIVLGVLENNFAQVPTLYPNPTNGRFSIVLDKVYPLVELKIRSMNGREVGRQRYHNSDRLEVEWKGRPGVYLVELVAGQQRAILKMVKE